MNRNRKNAAGEKGSASGLLFIAWLVITAVLLLLVCGLPKANSALTDTVVLEYGTLEVKDNVKCYFVRNENIYFSNNTGDVGYYVGEGESVRKGKEILTISTYPGKGKSQNFKKFTDTASSYLNGANLFVEDSSEINRQISRLNEELAVTKDEGRKYEISMHISQLNSALTRLKKSDQSPVASSPVYLMGTVPERYTSSYRGTVSYYLDGYEYAMNPDTMALLDENKLKKLSFGTTNVCTGVTTSGDPLFKVVSNDEWYAVFWVDAGKLSKYEEGKNVTLKLPLADVSGTICSISEANSMIRVIVKFTTYYPEMSSIRTADAEIITASSKGLIVPDDCLTTSGSAVGVYVKQVTGQYDFVPVKVQANYDGLSSVTAGYYYESIEENNSVKVSTVDLYDEVKRGAAQ